MLMNITKEDQEQSLFPIAILFYVLYKRGVDYKGLNESVTSIIYHMTHSAECIRRQTISKHHAYIMSTT
jgi:hypothetical protein